MRKASAAIGVLFAVALSFAALSIPAGAQATYPPVTTTIPVTPTTQPVTPTTQPPVTPTTQPVTPTTGAPATTPTTVNAGNAAANLAFTGSDSTPLVIVAIVAITLGAVLVVATRRRSSVRAPKA